MNLASSSTVSQILRDESHSLELSTTALPRGLMSLDISLKGKEVNRTLHVPPNSQARVQEILQTLVSAWNAGRAAGADFCLDVVKDEVSSESPMSLPAAAALAVGRAHLGAIADNCILEGKRLVLVNEPRIGLLPPELMGLLRQALQKFPQISSELNVLLSHLPVSFERTGKYYHLIRGSGPTALQTIAEEVSVYPPIAPFMQDLRVLVDAKVPAGNLKERLRAVMAQPPFHYVSLYTSDPLGARIVSVSSHKDLHAALEARGQSGALRAYRVNLQVGVSDIRAFEPASARPEVKSGRPPESEQRNFASWEEALAELALTGQTPKLNPITDRGYERNPNCSDIAREPVAAQRERYGSLRGKSGSILVHGSPIEIPKWLNPHMAAPAQVGEEAITHDYRDVPCADVPGESYAASTWRWRTGRFQVNGVWHTTQYEVRWHTKMSNFLEQAYPSFVVTRTVQAQTEAGDYKAVASQVLLNCPAGSPGLKKLHEWNVAVSSYPDGSVWIDEGSKKSAHGALTSVRRVVQRGDTKVMDPQLLDRARFAEAVNALVHHPYLPEYDSQNTHWRMTAHRLWIQSLNSMRADRGQQ